MEVETSPLWRLMKKISILFEQKQTFDCIIFGFGYTFNFLK